MIITFCGHNEIDEPEAVRQWLYAVIDRYSMLDEIVFYLGGYGYFDQAAASIAYTIKSKNIKLKSVLVLPYLNRAYDAKYYDYTLYPPLETVPKRIAIIKRNEWMVEQADAVVAYVTHGWGGAARTLAYAQRKGKAIIRYPSLPD